MEVVTVSSKYQVVIPRALRRAMDIKPGQKVIVEQVEGGFLLHPMRQITQYEGFLKGREIDFEREPDREI
jgi:AbrB family looped-hinge helix DNA binding protein